MLCVVIGGIMFINVGFLVVVGVDFVVVLYVVWGGDEVVVVKVFVEVFVWK